MSEAHNQKAWLGLGGNVGDVAANMREACVHLERFHNIRISRKSDIYRTPPWGPIAQDSFLNAAIEIRSKLKPRELLEFCLAIEREFGRIREERWGPRTLDIDILLMERGSYLDDALELPHPRMFERAFVLVPLLDLIPEMKVNGRKIKVWNALLDNTKIKRIGTL